MSPLYDFKAVLKPNPLGITRDAAFDQTSTVSEIKPPEEDCFFTDSYQSLILPASTSRAVVPRLCADTPEFLQQMKAIWPSILSQKVPEALRDRANDIRRAFPQNRYGELIEKAICRDISIVQYETSSKKKHRAVTRLFVLARLPADEFIDQGRTGTLMYLGQLFGIHIPPEQNEIDTRIEGLKKDLGIKKSYNLYSYLLGIAANLRKLSYQDHPYDLNIDDDMRSFYADYFLEKVTTAYTSPSPELGKAACRDIKAILDLLSKNKSELAKLSPSLGTLEDDVQNLLPYFSAKHFSIKRYLELVRKVFGKDETPIFRLAYFQKVIEKIEHCGIFSTEDTRKVRKNLAIFFRRKLTTAHHHPETDIASMALEKVLSVESIVSEAIVENRLLSHEEACRVYQALLDVSPFKELPLA